VNLLDSSMEAARDRRLDIMLDQVIDERLEVLVLDATKTMANPRAMKKLAPLIKFYAKKAHPFAACVRDNRKRFGPLTEKYCAVIVDIIHGGNTHWRNGGNRKISTGVHASDETPPFITEEMVGLLEALPAPTKERLNEIYKEAREVVAQS
jgi:hypothetical protein